MGQYTVRGRPYKARRLHDDRCFDNLSIVTLRGKMDNSTIEQSLFFEAVHGEPVLIPYVNCLKRLRSFHQTW